jgi:predicted GH43/DUF377 family glycosyl hydrolase
MDIARRNSNNPLLRPVDFKAEIQGMEIACLLNPGVFRYDGKTWLLLRVAERPVQQDRKISFPALWKKMLLLSSLKGMVQGFLVTVPIHGACIQSFRNLRLEICSHHSRRAAIDSLSVK